MLTIFEMRQRLLHNLLKNVSFYNSWLTNISVIRVKEQHSFIRHTFIFQTNLSDVFLNPVPLLKMFTVQAEHHNKTFQISEYNINIMQFIFVSSKEKIKKIKRKGGRR